MTEPFSLNGEDPLAVEPAHQPVQLALFAAHTDVHRPAAARLVKPSFMDWLAIKKEEPNG